MLAHRRLGIDALGLPAMSVALLQIATALDKMLVEREHSGAVCPDLFTVSALSMGLDPVELDGLLARGTVPAEAGTAQALARSTTTTTDNGGRDD